MKFNIRNISRLAAISLVSLISFSSCLDDLNQEEPRNENVNEIYNDAVANSFLAKIYSGFGMSSNTGPTGEDDLVATDGDQGSLVLLRGLITMQEFPTDELLWNWTDEGIVELSTLNWTYTTKYAYTFYQRAMLNLRYCKEFLDQFTEATGITNVAQMRDEVRAIRALNYYFLIDLYGNPGVVWDDSPVNEDGWYPSQIGRKELFELVEKDLLDLSENGNLPETASMATYGKMTKPVVWTILAKMYLNAEVYTGTAMYDKAADMCQKVINSGFGLVDNYANLFCGQNHLSAMPGNGNEIIFAIPFDNVNAKSYGNMIMLTAGAYGGALNPNWFGCTGSWTCVKAKQELVSKFDNAPDAGLDRFKSKTKADRRYTFFDVLSYNTVSGVDDKWPFDETGTIVYDVNENRKQLCTLSDWDAGYLSYKFTNLDWDGGKVTLCDFPDTDFPMFRLADIYLMYAECALRGSGDMSKALDYVNRLRDRAYGNQSGRITAGDLDLDFILDERSRELYWEAHRRTDLIRYGYFTQKKSWAYKGGTVEGNPNVSSKFNLYPISDKDLTSNPNLIQNPGYKSLR